MKAWELVYDGWDPGAQQLREALCTLGNGRFATRGAIEEASPGGIHRHGTYLAGGYNRATTLLQGRAIENEDLVNWPNWLPLTFRPEGGEWFSPETVVFDEYRQTLDLRRGVLSRHLRFRDRGGRTTSLVSRRLVHMREGHLAAIHWTLTPLDWTGRIEIRSGLDGNVRNIGVDRYGDLENRHLEFLESGPHGDDGIALVMQTNQSRIRMAQVARTRVHHAGTPLPAGRATSFEEAMIAQTLVLEARQERAIEVEKVVAIHTSRDMAISEPLLAAREAMARAGGFDDLQVAHEREWEHLWHRCDIRIGDDGHREAQIGLRLHIFHLLQTASRLTIDADAGVPARGLHGEAYRGHIFWDELFIFPFLNMSLPEVTRSLLLYRCRRLPQARAAARRAGHSGAMFPWQSGSDGREESQVMHLNPRSGRWVPDDTHLQRHVNAAIAYTVWQYYEATEDLDFMSFRGAEMLLEIARFWSGMSVFNEARGRYDIRGVVGPDEYHTRYPGAESPGLDNNAYTNIMAVWVLTTAQRVLKLIADDLRGELLETLGIDAAELKRWDDITRRMFVPFHDGQVISQFEGYEELAEFDWEGYREKYGDIQRLDRILEAEGDSTDRYKAAKQADVLMLFYLFSVDELRAMLKRLGYALPARAVARNIDYYLRRTSHGSTLSRIVHSWVLARTDRGHSWRWFQEALRSDIGDIQGGTTREGIHLGAMAGTTDLFQRCFVGISIRDDVLWFDPRLPEGLQDVGLRVRYRGLWVAVRLSADHLRVGLEKGWYVGAESGPGRKVYRKIGFKGKVYRLGRGETKVFHL